VARGDFKADPRQIVRAHRRTYIDASTGRPRWQDRLAFEGLPLAVLGLCLGLGVELKPAASAGLLTVAGLLSALLFGVLVQISGTAMGLADSQPEPSAATSNYATFLVELAANASYASLVCILAAAIYVVAGLGSGWVLRISSALGLAVATHLVLVLMMVMKRVFALTQERLLRARTGADRPAQTPHRRAG
jgi:membrane protease YdiL (CAAX protease family)